MLILDQPTHATTSHRTTTLSSFPSPFHHQQQPAFTRKTTTRIRQHPTTFLSPTTTQQPQPIPSYHNCCSCSSTALYSHAGPTGGGHGTTGHQVVAATAATAAVAAVSPSSTLLRMMIVFVAGGLFFSSALTFATACYAIGKDNIQRFSEMTKIVWESVWLTFTMGLTATKETLLGSRRDRSSFSLRQRYRQAWQVLRCKLAETRRTAVQGVQAIQREVKLTAAAVGVPGLIPLQYMIDRQLSHTIGGGIESALQEAVGNANIGSNVDLKLSHFDIGTVAPKLESARVYDLGNDAMAFDYDIKWDSEMQATIQVHSNYLPGTTHLPVTLHNLQFKGPVRVIMTPLTKEYPGFGAMLISFPTMPEIGMDIRVAGGELTKVIPKIRSEILTTIQQSIEDSMIWPKRTVVPSFSLEDPQTPILSAEELKRLETTDPLLEAEEALGTRPVLRRKLNQIESDIGMVHAYNGDHRCSDEEVLKSLVDDDLPLPTFQTDVKHKKMKTPTSSLQRHHQHNAKRKLDTMTSKPTIMAMAGDPTTLTGMIKMDQYGKMIWGQLHDVHQRIVDRSHADLVKTRQLLSPHVNHNSNQQLPSTKKIGGGGKLKEMQHCTSQ